MLVGRSHRRRYGSGGGAELDAFTCILMGVVGIELLAIVAGVIGLLYIWIHG